jgi:hypothetical protein
MDERTIEVEHRLDELRRDSALLRAERDATRTADAAPFGGLRRALGRRLVAVGTAIQDGARPTAGRVSH